MRSQWQPVHFCDQYWQLSFNIYQIICWSHIWVYLKRCNHLTDKKKLTIYTILINFHQEWELLDVILLGTQLPTGGGVDDKQVICNNLQNHFWSHLHFFCTARVRRPSFCNGWSSDELFSWSTLLEVSEQTARQSRSLRQMLSTNKFSTRKWSLWNDTTKLNNRSCVFNTEIFWLIR